MTLIMCVWKVIKVSGEVGEGMEKIGIWILGDGNWRLSIPD